MFLSALVSLLYHCSDIFLSHCKLQEKNDADVSEIFSVSYGRFHVPQVMVRNMDLTGAIRKVLALWEVSIGRVVEVTEVSHS